jgi:hypothetical protein
MYTRPYITANPHLFLDTSWISIPALRSFLQARDRGGSERDTAVVIPSVEPTRVKLEFDASNAPMTGLAVKSEPISGLLPVRTRSQLEGGREVIELLSDSDEDDSPNEFGM